MHIRRQRPVRASVAFVAAASLTIPWACGTFVRAAEPSKIEAAKQRYAAIVADELQRKITPGVSVAWIVDGRVVLAAGYGLADWEKQIPATADTIYRAGSISKLFNAVAAMQLVEQGKLDLDSSIQTALPDFRIVVPFADAGPLTARQMLCHRSGMIREAPVGGYLDPSQPTVAATVASVASCALVNPPNSKTRYSNVGPTIVGRAVEVITGEPYVAYQQRHVLGPLGMKSSAFLMSDSLRPRLAKGMMRVNRGGTYIFEAAPEFELGTIPAGNLYTSAADLARFAVFMMGGEAPDAGAAILRPESLATMYVPQLTREATGFGIGFLVGRYRDHPTVQHNGAVYGFSTSLVVLPKEKIAAIVLTNADIAGAPVKRLSDAALDLLLEAVHDEPLPKQPATTTLPPESLTDLVGDYESASYWARVYVEGGALRCTLSGQQLELAAESPLKFLADGRIMSRAKFEFERGADSLVVAFLAAGQKFTRVPADLPADVVGWKPLLGSYGPKFIPLVVTVRHGHLYGSVENEFDYRLTSVNRVTFNLPPGMYADEQVVFQLDPSGRAIGALLANQYLERQRD